MSDRLAEEIRDARESQGWDQAELARLLGVGQQTISRWEHGRTAPKGALLDRLRAALGMDGVATPPRRPLLEELPFNRFDGYQFEAFCEAVASRVFPDAQELMRYGVSGDTQHGIDIRVVTAAGERIGIQCKKYAKFQPSSFEKTVAELDRARARVDRCILLLSTQATAKVREACDERAEWSIWDSRDLSRKVRELPSDQAISLVARFFPDMREEFLGVRTPSVWRTSADAFPASVHEFQFVGRQEVLDAMLAFAAGGDDTPRVAVLTGSAGLGKSRLLYELARQHDCQPGATTRLLLPEPITPEAFEHLPTGSPLLVLVDDAHERSDDLAMLVSRVLRERPTAKVVLATRPYGRHVVQRALRAGGVDDRAAPKWDLAALKSAEAHALASDILGNDRGNAARILAQVAADSPLLLVSTANAVKRGQLAIEALEIDEDVRQLLLDVFLQSALSQSQQPDTDHALLHAVAAVQPVATDVPHFQETLSTILRMPFSRINPQLRRLESTGIVVRRGASVRISPDLLGDVLLAEAAVLPHNGSSTGYLEHVRDCAEGDALANALINAGRVDWQWNSRLHHRKGVIDPLWTVLEAGFKSSGAYTRAELLRLVRKVAPFQPRRAFELAQWALDNPTEHDDRPVEAHWVPGRYGHADVLREVPRVLEAVAVDLDQLRSVYNLLWALGRDDERPLNQHPDGPLRILLDLASYEPGKPLAYQEILIDALSEWQSEGTPNPANRMPLALLDPFFSTTAESRTMEAQTLTISRHPLLADSVAAVRERAIGMLLDEYASGDEVRGVIAARTFAEVLRFQTEEFEPFNIGFLRALAGRTRSGPPGPLVSLAVRRSLSWAVKHGPAPIGVAAQQVLSALPDTVEHRLALLLHTGAFDRRFVPRVGDDRTAEASWTALRHRTVDELRGLPKEQVAECFVALVESGHRAFASNAEGVPGFVSEALKEIPELTSALNDRLSTAEDLTVDLMLRTVLHTWIEHDASRALDACRQIVAGGRPAQLRAVTQALQDPIREVSVQEEGALALAHSMADHPDPSVRAGVLNMAVSMLRSSREAGLDLLTSVRFGDLKMELHHLWWAFTMDDLLSWRDLTADQREFFLGEVTSLRRLEDHSVQQFIAHIASFDDAAAIALLCARVERWESGLNDERFDPLPFEWSVPLPLSSSPDRMDLLRSVRDWLAQPREHTWCREMHAPDLFWTVAGSVDDAVLSLLLEPYRTGATDLAHAVAPLLGKIPRDTVWDRVGFVTEAVQMASLLSEKLLGRTAGKLRAAVFSGVRWGTPGQPYQEDIDIREHAQRIRAGLPRGSAVDRFYKSLQEDAERQIEQATTEGHDGV